MIVECEKCGSTFNLDDTLIQEMGSKVRCSVCKHTFTVLPIQEDDEIEPLLEETESLDSLPADDEEENTRPEPDDIFDKAFEEALQDDIEEDAVEEEEPEPQVESEPTAAKREKKGKGSLLIFLIILLIIISGAISVYLFAPDLLPDSLSGLPVDEEELTDTGYMRLSLVDVSQNFLVTDKIGQLFIIKGKVLNEYSGSRSHILLKGIIEDENKKPVAQKLVYAGNIFTERELKGMTKEEIEKGMASKTGKFNSNVDVEPQASLPFMIIFYDLPDNITEMVVDPVSSSPGN